MIEVAPIVPPVIETRGLRKVYAEGSEAEVVALKGVDPVSYTHLDVYKRQVQCSTGA